MDSSKFDALIRRFGHITRRTSLKAPVLGLLGLALPALDAPAAEARRGPRAQGPCGNRGPKANRCRRHRQCCTGYCNKKIGRCRCRKRGQTCTSQANCCGTALSCQRQGSARRCLPNVPRPPEPDTCDLTLSEAGCAFLSNIHIWDCGGRNLSGLDLSDCVLMQASFFDANLSGVNFTGTALTGANFFQSNVTGVVWSNTICPTGTNSDTNGDTCCGEFVIGQVPIGC